MSFEQNLFISYARIDDKSLTPGEGWITRFHADLNVMLSMRMGREAKIWRDVTELDGTHVLSDEIVAQFKNSAALVSIITSRYLNSEWCMREIREFCQSAQQNGGLVVGNRLRVFKVIKTPVDTQHSLPPPMSDVLGYEFFTYKDGVPLEFDPAYGQEYAQLYKLNIAKLAWEITQLLKTLEANEPQAPSKVAVYLAETSYDRKQARGLIEGELKRLGYTVLPDKPLPMDEGEYIAAVESLLARCALSIHLVGELYGAVPDGATGKSASIHQNELAVARCKRGDLKRLIWLPRGTGPKEPLQLAFIDTLDRDAQAQFGADLITGNIEELRAALHATLHKIEQPEPKVEAAEAQATDGNNTKLIYLICDDKDRRATVPVRKFCKQMGVEVALPAFEGDASQVRKTNQQLLAGCDAVLLFYGAGDEAWKRTIDNDLKKMAGYRGGKPLPAIHTYLAEPKTRDKDDLIDMEEPGLIDGLAGLAETSLTEFLRAVRGANS